MKIQHLLSISLSLSLMACQISDPLVSAPTANTVLMQAESPTQPVALNHKANVHFAGDTEQLRLQLQLPGFRTQLAQPEQLAFIKVTLVGEGIAAPITQDGDEFLPVNDAPLNVTLSNIPTDNGKLRLVRVEGFNASQEPLGAFEASAWYRSQTGVTTVNLTLNRAQNLLYDLLNALLTDRESALNGLDIPALQALLLSEVLQYSEQTGEFGTDPALFDGVAMAALINAGDPLPDASALRDKEASLHPVSVSVVRDTGSDDFAEPLRFVLSDPVSQSVSFASGTASGTSVMFEDIPVGDWELVAYNAAAEVVGRIAVTVTSDGQGSTGPLIVSGVSLFVGEFRVNTRTSSAQSNPSIAMADNGDFVVAWQDLGQDGSSRGVYAQRYDADGIAQGSEFRVNTETSEQQENPSVAMDADGDFVVIWSSNIQDGSGHGIYGQRYNASGVAQGSEFRVNTYTTVNQDLSSVAMDADGDFVVIWQSDGQDGSTNGIYGQRYNASGVAQGSEFRVNTYTSSGQVNPSVAMDADGDFVVTWQSSGQDGWGDGIYGQRYNAGGIAQGSEFRVNTYTSFGQKNPSVAMASDGDFVVTWESFGQDGDNYGIYGQRYNASGVAQGSEFRVNTETANTQGSPSVAMAADVDFVVTWQSDRQDGSVYGIYGQRYNANGMVQGSEFQVNTYTTFNQEFSSIAMSAGGDFVVTWQSETQDGSLDGIYGQRYDANGEVK